MTAQNPTQRRKTAKSIAEKVGCSPATVYRLQAEPREEFVARAAQRRSDARQMREAGMSYKDIAGAMDLSVPAVKSLLQRARRERAAEQGHAAQKKSA